ncbi:MAG: PASTA domain-containing protein [bacterium]
MLKKIFLFTGVLLCLFFLANNVLMPLYVKHSDTVKVPKITGMNYIEAKKLIEEGGLEIKQSDVKFDESIPIGQILDQNPPAEEIVKYGRRIYVIICGGEQLSEVPNLKGKSLRDAKFSLEQRGLKLGETVRKNTNEIPEDYVISQIIQPGSRVKRNSILDLILSDGPVVGDLKVPSLTGKNLEEAKKIITENNLKVGKITYQTNNELKPGQIIDQYPKFDKSANENTSIDLFVARKKVIIQRESDEESGDNATTTETAPKDETAKKPDIQKEKPKELPSPDKPADKKTEKVPVIKKEEVNPNKSEPKKEGDKK